FCGKWFDIGKTKWERPGKLPVSVDQWKIFVLRKPPCSVDSFAGIGRRNPVIDRGWDHANGVCRVGLLSDDNQRIGAAPFAGSAEVLHLVERSRVQVQVFPQGCHISRLLAHDLGARILDDARAMYPGFCFRPDKVLCGLADSPNAGVAFSSSSEQLNNFGREDRRIEQEPALIKHGDARLPGLARSSLCRRMSN